MTESTTPPTSQDTDPKRAALDDDARLDKDLDKDLEETFPASDPPATSGITKIGTDGQEKGTPKDKTGDV